MFDLRNKTRSVMLVALLAILACSAYVRAEGLSTPTPIERYELKLIGIFEGAKREYIFAIGESGFRTVETLKRFLGARPRGTEVRWAPGCTRFGTEPLLSSQAEMDDFRKFLEDRGIKFTLVPSG